MVSVGLSLGQSDTSGSSSADRLMALSFEELLNVRVSPSSLTPIRNGLEPIGLFSINAEEIRLSGARDLDELLEIFVPGFQI